MTIAAYRFGKIHIDGQTRTHEAVKDFNQLQEQHARVVAALHLTC